MSQMPIPKTERVCCPIWPIPILDFFERWNGIKATQHRADAHALLDPVSVPPPTTRSRPPMSDWSMARPTGFGRRGCHQYPDPARGSGMPPRDVELDLGCVPPARLIDECQSRVDGALLGRGRGE
jgi:hypothetical protein